MKLLNALKALHDAVPSLQADPTICALPFSAVAGICRNVNWWLREQQRQACELSGMPRDKWGQHIYMHRKEIRDAEDQLDALMARWPHHCGQQCYPVEGSDEFYEDFSKNRLWHNPKRLELLNWLIEQLETEQ